MPFLPPNDQAGDLRASRPSVALDPTAWAPTGPPAALSGIAGSGQIPGQPFLPPLDVQPPPPPPPPLGVAQLQQQRTPFLPPIDYQPAPPGPVAAAPIAPTGNPNMQQIGNMFGAPHTGGNNVQPPMNAMQTKPMAMAPANPFQRPQQMSDRRQMLAKLLMRRNRGAF
jgi:hypothetical protein